MDNIQEPRRYTRYYFGSGGVDHAVDTDTNKTFCGRDVPAGAKLDSSWVTGISCIRCASKIPALGAQAAYVREYNQYHRLVRAVEDIEEHLALIEKNKEEAKAKRAIARYRKGLLVGLRDHIRLSNRPTRLEETQLMDELLDEIPLAQAEKDLEDALVAKAEVERELEVEREKLESGEWNLIYLEGGEE